MENENENEDLILDKKRCEIEFDQFRIKYPGTKRGLKTEFDYFKKNNKDWQIILPKLLPIIKDQIQKRLTKTANKEFVPEWKNLKTWIFNKCWEEEMAINNSPEAMKIFTYQELVKMVTESGGDKTIWDKYKIIDIPGKKKGWVRK